MNKEITAEDIIKAIDEMFDDEKLQESETFSQGYNYGILKASQYLVHIQQELQRKDNEIKQLRKDIKNHIKIASEYKEQMIIKDNIIKQTIGTIKELIDDSEDTTCYEITNTVKKLLLEELENDIK